MKSSNYRAKILRGGLTLLYVFFLISLGACSGVDNLLTLFESGEASAAEVGEDRVVDLSNTSPISMPPKAMPMPPEVVTVEASVYVWSLRVRAGAGTDTLMIGGLRYQDTLSLDGRNADGSWVKFSDGWVAAEHLHLEDDIRDLPILTGEIDLMIASPSPNTTNQQASASGTEVGAVSQTLYSAPNDSP